MILSTTSTSWSHAQSSRRTWPRQVSAVYTRAHLHVTMTTVNHSHNHQLVTRDIIAWSGYSKMWGDSGDRMSGIMWYKVMFSFPAGVGYEIKTVHNFLNIFLKSTAFRCILSTALTWKAMKWVPSVFLSRFQSNFDTPLSLTFCMCTCHDHSAHGIKGQGQRSRLGLMSHWKQSAGPRPQSRTVFLVCTI